MGSAVWCLVTGRLSTRESDPVAETGVDSGR